MHDLAASRTDTESYVVAGWSALEHNDLAAARAALEDLYTADPTHPGLPLLAAGIRRIRPKPVRWRAGVLLIVIVAAAIVTFRSWNSRDRVMPPPKPTTTKTEVGALLQSTAPAEVRSERGATGGVQAQKLLTATQDPSSATLDEDVIVRQAIQRFEATYRNRWGGLAFEHCAISRDVDEATAICIPRPAAQTSGVEPDRVWKFFLRKADGAWRIASVQPPPNSGQ